MSRRHSSRAPSALPLCSRQILEKRSHTGSGASRASIPGKKGCPSHVVSVVPEEVMQPPSGFGSAGGKVSCYSLGGAGFRAPGLHLSQNHSEGAAGEPALSAHCLLLTPLCAPPSGPHKGPAKQVSSAPWLLPSPLLQLTSNSFLLPGPCFLLPGPCFLLPGPCRGPAILLTSYA